MMSAITAPSKMKVFKFMVSGVLLCRLKLIEEKHDIEFINERGEGPSLLLLILLFLLLLLLLCCCCCYYNYYSQ